MGKTSIVKIMEKASGHPVKVGDRVITSKYSGTEIKIDGTEYIIVSQNDILAVVE